MWSSVGMALVLLLAVGTTPARARGTTTWFTYTHGHLNQTISGGNSGGYLRTYGWTYRRDDPSRFSLTLGIQSNFLWEGPASFGVLYAKLFSLTGHYRFDAPRRRASLFLGYGALQLESSTDLTHFWARGLLLGADVQYELRNRWLLIGSFAWGPWRTTLGGLGGPGANSTFLDYRLALAIPHPRTPNVYFQLGYRGIGLSQIPGSVLCVTTPCSVNWSAQFEVGLVFVSRQLPPLTTPAPAVGPGAGIWYKYTHGDFHQIINGVRGIQQVRSFGWSIRKDFPSPYSLTLNFMSGVLWNVDPAFGVLAPRLGSVTAHYRLERPRLQASVFAGYGMARIEASGAPNVLESRGLLAGVDVQYQFRNRMLLTGSVAWGPSWRTTVPGGSATGSYLDYRIGLAVPVPRTHDAYYELAWRSISLSGVPGFVLCTSPPCTINWAGVMELGLVFGRRSP